MTELDTSSIRVNLDLWTRNMHVVDIDLSSHFRKCLTIVFVRLVKLHLCVRFALFVRWYSYCHCTIFLLF